MIAIVTVQQRVAEHYRLPLRVMSERPRHYARQRQIAMYLSYELTGKSLPQIGRRFGGRDHTTVIHALRTVERLKREDPEIAVAITEIREALS